MNRPPRKPGKHDVEMARLESRHDIGMVCAYGGVVVVCLLASAVPLLVLHGSIVALAGKKTVVDLNFVVSISLVLSGLGNLLQYLKGTSRRSEMKRMRKRMDDMEDELEA
jgi:hypothetical protein